MDFVLYLNLKTCKGLILNLLSIIYQRSLVLSTKIQNFFSMDNIFFEQLTIILKSRNITGNKLCQKLGISNANYSNWKKGTPKAEIICKIADELNITTDYLLGRSGTDPELPEDEIELLQNYRKSDEKMKKLIRKMAEEAADQEPDHIKRQA